MGAAFVDARPTGTRVSDIALCALVGFLFPLTAASSRRWVWPIVSGVALVIADTIWGRLLGATALGFALHAAGFARRRDRLTGAVVGALSVQALLRSADIGFHGFTALLVLATYIPLAASAYRNLRRRNRRRVRNVALGLSFFVALSVVGLMLSVYAAKRDLDSGVSHSRAGLDAAMAGEQTVAADEWQLASSRFAAADEALDNPWLKTAYVVPVLAQHAKAVTNTAHSGAAISSTASTAARVAPYRSLRSSDGRINIQAIRRMQQPVALTAASLRDAQHSLDSVDSQWLLPVLQKPLATYGKQLDRALPEADRAEHALMTAPELLGGNGTRRYLVLFGTPSETRGLGGFIGSWAQLDADNGKLTLSRSGNIKDLNDAAPPGTRKITGQPEYVRRYSYLQPTTFLQNVSASPDFPTVADVATQLYGQSGGPHVDGVIYVDPYALAAFLKLTGPVIAEGIPMPLTSDNTAEFLLNGQYVEFPDTDLRKDLLSNAADATFEALTTRDLPSIASISDELSPMVHQNRLLLSVSDKKTNSFLSTIGLTGAFPTRPGTDLYSLRTSNGSGNKIDFFLHRSIAYDVQFNPKSGATTSTATITLENQAPTSGQPNYVLGNEDTNRNIPNGRPYASNTVNFSFYSPLNVKSLTINGTRTGVQAGRELGVNVYSGTVTIPAGQSAQVAFELSGNLAPGGTYRLLIDRQPVVHPDKVSTTVRSSAPGVRVVGPSTVEGGRATSQLLETSVELTRRFTR